MLHKGKKITLLPLTPAEIVQSDTDGIENEKKERILQYENQQVAKQIFPPGKEQVATSSRSDEIKLRGVVMLATKEDLDAITDDDLLCYALISTNILFYLPMLLVLCLLLPLTFCRSMKMFSQLRFL